MSSCELELWADSFHEGYWCCEQMMFALEKQVQGFSFQVAYEKGFQPIFKFVFGDINATIAVFGNYKSWSPLPDKVATLLDWGKPDFIMYSPEKDEILFSVEETAATATGNQSMQRLERQYGSARALVPYWYLVSEYGMHVDGGVRRDSIWPIVAGIKLTIQKNIPSVVVHYSDLDNLEDYEAGTGLNNLFQSVSMLTLNFISDLDPLSNIRPLLEKQYGEMLEFLDDQWENILDYLPSESQVKCSSTASSISYYAIKLPEEADDDLDGFLHWPTTSELPSTLVNGLHSSSLLKHDPFLKLVEADLDKKRAYTLSSNAGSGKPPTTKQVERYIKEQQAKFDPMGLEDLRFSLKISDFPFTNERRERHHLTTAKNIVYLYDRWGDVACALEKAYPRLQGIRDKFPSDMPAFLYVSNSMKLGRIFGDPFTGQLTGYSTIFGRFDSARRLVIAYFPHQVHSQVFTPNRTIKKNKGITLMSELTDLTIFHGGAAVCLRTGELL